MKIRIRKELVAALRQKILRYPARMAPPTRYLCDNTRYGAIRLDLATCKAICEIVAAGNYDPDDCAGYDTFTIGENGYGHLCDLAHRRLVGNPS